ncbi:MAG: hypothetical protein K2X43_12735 [Hyphomonadaceae bacterium]|nr:hypothetical protein [Hyphomonadaceae bacterium]
MAPINAGGLGETKSMRNDMLSKMTLAAAIVAVGAYLVPASAAPLAPQSSLNLAGATGSSLLTQIHTRHRHWHHRHYHHHHHHRHCRRVCHGHLHWSSWHGHYVCHGHWHTRCHWHHY